MPLHTRAAPADRLAAGPMEVEADEGRLRVRWNGAEVVREIDCPIRDADWRTLPVEEIGLEVRATDGGFTFTRRFRTLDGGFVGELAVEAAARDAGGTLTATLILTPARDAVVNRAGFVLLHPIVGVAGTPLAVRHPDGNREDAAFPARISAGQPVRDIAGLAHRVGGVDLDIDFEGETFEMEDQRNWTDASFKTYCRPLGLPRPFAVPAGEPIHQKIRLTLRPATAAAIVPAAASAAVEATMPRITLAADAGANTDAGASPLVARVAADGLLLRLSAGDPVAPPADLPVTLEIVTGADPQAEIAAVADACRAAGLSPRRVVALPRAYLASHQPEGPWPAPRPMDLLPLVRAAFPQAEAGGGVLTNFTELNRCPPDPSLIDFATFGTTAIVHAAGDRAVAETLEALPQVFESAAALVPGRPLHLGLVSIGMRSNPYGSAVAPNTGGQRLAMAMDDPRQRLPFAGAFAIAAAAAAARTGVASFAPAMTSGPLGLGDASGPWPILEAVAALAAIGGARVRIEGSAPGLVLIRAGAGASTRTLAANLSPEPADALGQTVAPYAFAVLS